MNPIYLSEVAVRNFAGARSLGLSLGGAVLFGALNAQGKSSLHDAISLAFCGSPGRALKAAELKALVGPLGGTASVQLEGRVDGAVRRVRAELPGGRFSPLVEHPAALYLCAPARYAGLDDAGRMALLYAVSGESVGPAAVEKKLRERGADAARAAAVAPLVVSSFDTAEKFAKEKAAEARGGWKSITGETYGAVKAEAWAPAPPPDADERVDLVELTSKTATARERLDECDRRVNSVKALRSLEDQLAARLTAARAAVAKRPELRESLAAAQQNLDKERAAVAALEIKLAPALSCPHCAALVRLEGGALVAASGEPVTDADHASLVRHQKAMTRLEGSVANLTRALAEADAAEGVLKDAGAPEGVPNEGQLVGLELEALALRGAWQQLQTQLDGIVAARASAEARGQQVRRAMELHGEVSAWMAIAAALSPTEIPAELSSAVVAPINAALRADADLAGWAMPVVSGEGALGLSGRPYALLSESEKWRVDALLAFALARVSGLRVVCLDRFDVLDLPSRGGFMRLVARVSQGEGGEPPIQVLLFGTMKAPLKAPLPWLDAHWLELGELVQRPAVAALA